MFFRKSKSGSNTTEKKVDTTQELFYKNSGKVLIGIYDSKNDEITLQLAIQDKVDLLINEETGEFLGGQYLIRDPKDERIFNSGDNLSEKELKKLNLNHKDSIPRMYTLQTGETGSGHIYMVKKMLDINNINNYWGFSVTPGKTFERTGFKWTSRSLNQKININHSNSMPLAYQMKVLQHIQSYIQSEKPAKQMCLMQ